MNCLRERFVSTNCRLCLQDDNILLDIFEKDENDEVTPADIIRRLLDPQVCKDDGYPRVCCLECIRKLKMFQSMDSSHLSPSFMLFREQNSIAKAVYDCSYFECSEQHSPISEDHSPLCLNLDSYASVEEQKWHYYEILKAVAHILGRMNEEKELNLNQSPLQDNLFIDELKSSQQKTKNSRKMRAAIFPRRSKRQCQNKESKVKKEMKEKQRYHKGRSQCPTCGILCTRKDLASHFALHTNERPFPCSICSKTFRHQRNLRVHLKIHYGVKDLRCAHCDKTFRNRSLLKSHLITHDQKKPFSCAQCGKLFKRVALVKVHMKTHTNDRPHKCKICGVAFIQRSELTKHLPVHSGLRAFSCSVCKKKFAHKRNLKEHERIHRKEEQFECAHCGRRWAQKSNLKMHLTKGCSMQRIRVKVE